MEKNQLSKTLFRICYGEVPFRGLDDLKKNENKEHCAIHNVFQKRSLKRLVEDVLKITINNLKIPVLVLRLYRQFL